jgi:hypothetical protein
VVQVHAGPPSNIPAQTGLQLIRVASLMIRLGPFVPATCPIGPKHRDQMAVFPLPQLRTSQLAEVGGGVDESFTQRWGSGTRHPHAAPLPR